MGPPSVLLAFAAVFPTSAAEAATALSDVIADQQEPPQRLSVDTVARRIAPQGARCRGGAGLARRVGSGSETALTTRRLGLVRRFSPALTPGPGWRGSCLPACAASPGIWPTASRSRTPGCGRERGGGRSGRSWGGWAGQRVGASPSPCLADDQELSIGRHPRQHVGPRQRVRSVELIAVVGFPVHRLGRGGDEEVRLVEVACQELPK